MTRARRWLVALAIAAGVLMPAAGPAAQTRDDAPPAVLFTADEVSYDQERGLVRAAGNVEASYGDRVLLAREVVFDQRRNLVTAEGDVALVEPTGEVLFADRVELTGDLRNGVIENIRAVLSDDARFAATGARRMGGNVTDMRKAVYSPCNLCPENPSAPPLWQIKSGRVVHDQADKEIVFNDAWLEVAGLPFIYTPYLSQPDPTVRRKTGFLVPSFGNSSDLGFVSSIPFYVVIDDQRDATITPIFTTNEGFLLDVEYRQAMMQGALEINASGTQDSDQDFRGHVFSELRYDLDETWRMGVDFNRSTDDTYLRRYRISNAESLTSRAFLEGFRGRNYLVANAYGFQRLEEEEPDQEPVPVVVPLIDYYHVGEPDRFGGRRTLHLDFSAVHRQSGPEYRRISARAGYALPLRDRLGSIYTLSAALWADGYNVNSQTIEGEPGTFSGVAGRLLPQASLEWRYPLLRSGEAFDHVIQPVVEIIAAPNGGNPEEIPNEDSRDAEFSETNLFGFQRLPGLDRVESGTRLNYGLEWQMFRLAGGSLKALVGNAYRFSTNTEFAPASSPDRQLGDLVGDIRVEFPPWVGLSYRTRLDSETFDFNRNEVSFNVGVPALRFSGGYVFFRELVGDIADGREELNLAVQSQFSRYWRARAYGTRDLVIDRQLILGGGLTYEDECLRLDFSYEREKFEDRDLQPRDSFFVQLSLKTLGDVAVEF